MHDFQFIFTFLIGVCMHHCIVLCPDCCYIWHVHEFEDEYSVTQEIVRNQGRILHDFHTLYSFVLTV